MKKIIIVWSLVLFDFLLPAQDYSLLYREAIDAPSAPSLTTGKSATSNVKGVSYNRLLIVDKYSLYYYIGLDSVYNEEYQNDLKGLVYYGDLSKQEILKVEKTYETGYATKYPFYRNSDWKIHKEYIAFQKYKAYLATMQLNNGEIIKAYFIPQIVITIGPEHFSGLPGLIIRLERKGKVLNLIKLERPKLKEIDRKGLDTLKLISNEDFVKEIRNAILKKAMTPSIKKD